MEVISMLNISQYSEDLIIHYLIITVKNYNLKNINIAAATGLQPNVIGQYIKGERKPSKKNKELLWNYLKSIWQSGIICLPKLSNKWNKDYYLPVADLKNPFETWIDNGYHGVKEKEFEEWLSEWEKLGEYQIIKIYKSYNEFEKYKIFDQSSYNFTSELLSKYSVKQIFNLNLNLSELAFDLISQEVNKKVNERA